MCHHSTLSLHVTHIVKQCEAMTKWVYHFFFTFSFCKQNDDKVMAKCVMDDVVYRDLIVKC